MARLSVEVGRRAWWVDAFIGDQALGNPAVVVLLESALADEGCQQIAAELAVAETAFLRRGPDGSSLRCFTPTQEVDLFGHATLAALHVLFAELDEPSPEIVFSTRSGPIAGRVGELGPIVELPRHEVGEIDADEARRALSGVRSAWLSEGGELVCIVDDYDALCALDPDRVELFLLPATVVIACCPGVDGADVALRVFAPRLGIREDPVTGRALCALAPIWEQRTGARTLVARQLSPRGGVMTSTLLDDHVDVAGRTRTFLSGQLWA